MNLFEAARRRRLEAHRPGTRRNMISCQRLYLQFCLVMDIPLETPGVDDLGAFAEWLIRAGMAPSTIANYLSAVKTLNLMWDLSEPIEVFNSYAWSLTMKAVKHAVRPVLNNRAAVTFDHLKLLVRACNREAALGSLKIALVFGYLGFLRVSNLAPYTCSEFDPTRHTTWEDIHPSRDGVLICLKWTKTRQAAPYTAPVPLSTLGSSELCPLTLWQDYVDRLSHIEISPQMPFLLTTGSPTGKWVTVPMLRIMMRRAAHLAGLSEFGYTPHSLRRGGASFSYLAGVPLDHIKFHGTWTSNAVEGYLISQPRFNTPVAQAFKSLITP